MPSGRVFDITAIAFSEISCMLPGDANFHKKIRARSRGQEKSERKNSERTASINAIPCGRLIG